MTKEQRDLLKEAFLQVYVEEYDSFVAAGTDVVFSEKFEKKSQKLINHLDSYWTYMSKHSKRFLTVLIAAILLFTSTMSVTAFRKSILDFAINVYETFTEIFFEEKQTLSAGENDTIETVYSLTYLPEGYTEISSEISQDFVYRKFQKQENAHLIFKQMPLSSKISSDTESTTFRELRLANRNIYISSNKGQDVIIWHDDQCFCMLICAPSLNLSEIEKIIVGITVIP